MIAYHLLSGLALLQLSTTSVHAGAIETCAQQNDCLDFKVTKKHTDVCNLGGACSFEACIDLNTNDAVNPNCVKNGDKISHLCDKSMSNTCPNAMPPGMWDVDELENGTGNTAVNQQCQTGLPGETLFFAYKDGAGANTAPGCSAGDPAVGTSQIDFLTDDGLGQVSCRSRNNDIVSKREGKQ